MWAKILEGIIAATRDNFEAFDRNDYRNVYKRINQLRMKHNESIEDLF